MSGMSEMGGNETTRVFAVHLEIQFFFFWGGGGDVEDATSVQCGMDAKNFS
jgi:hypothetical protein